MESFRSLWLLLAIVVALFGTGFCIRCFQCTSRRDPKCADPMSGESRAVECTRDSITNFLHEINHEVRGIPGISDMYSGSVYSCVKINSLNQQKNTTTIRGCYYEKSDGSDICTTLRSKMVDQTALPFCETCSSDACNGSNGLRSTFSFTGMLLPFVAVYFLRQ